MEAKVITKEIQDKLSAEFPSRDIKWLPKITTKKGPNKTRVNIERNGQRVAGCMAHIDARQVMTRLDEAVGAGQWEDTYQASAIPGGVECALTVLGVTKTDVGTPSDQDPVKGAYSDALKRAAVKFGVGRHLYDIPTQWLPFDGWKITGTPELAGNQPPPEKKKLQPQSESVIVDLRATIEGGTDGKVTLGFIANRATMTGLYENTGERDMSQHAFKAALLWDGWPEENGKFKKADLNNGSVMPADKGLELFDWLVARKETK